VSGQSVDYSTLSGPSSTLIPSGGERTPEQVRHAQLNVADYVKGLGLPPAEEEEAALSEVLQMLGLVPTQRIDHGW
jgi:hypothetical protein